MANHICMPRIEPGAIRALYSDPLEQRMVRNGIVALKNTRYCTYLLCRSLGYNLWRRITIRRLC